MHILLLSYEYPPLGGGGGVAAQQHARAWVARGHAVTVLTSGTADLPAFMIDDGVAVYRVRVPGRTARATASLVSLLWFPLLAVWFARRWQPATFGLINSFFAIPSGVAGAWLARRWQRPHVVTVLGGDVYDPSKRLSPHRTPGLKQVVGHVLHRADAVIAESQDLAERAMQIYRLRQAVHVVPLGLDLAPAAPVAHPATPMVLITVARLVRRKRIDALLGALARLPAEAVRLVLVGDGPERMRLEELAVTLGITARVQFCGYLSEAEKLAALRCADLFVLVSEHEGFGLVYLEAAAQGLPMVAATVGGQTDFLIHGRTGWLVPSGDEQRLAQAVAVLITQPKLRHWMGQQAQQVAATYQIDRVADTYLQVLHGIYTSNP